jgi:hypothetical protein
MRKITSISKIGGSISIIFNDGERAVFYPFSKTVYTQTSPGVLKKTLSEFKKDIVKTNWNVIELSKLYIESYGN